MEFEVDKVLENLNQKLYDYSEKLSIENEFGSFSNSFYSDIRLNYDDVLWNSENDDREWISLTKDPQDEEKEDIYIHLLKVLKSRRDNLNKIIEALGNELPSNQR